MANPNKNFNKAYNAVGNPGTVFDTPVVLQSFDIRNRHIQNSVSQSYDREVPDVSSFRLQVFGGGAYLPSSTVTLTLQLTSGKTLPFEIDLSSDLVMFVNGQIWQYIYTSKWFKNTATITFAAPPTLGLHQVTFSTTSDVNTHQAKASLQVVAAPLDSGLYLRVVEVQPKDSRDVTILSLSGCNSNGVIPTFGANSTFKATSTFTSKVENHVETYRITIPAPSSGVWGLAPFWAAFKLRMKHFDLFKDLRFDLSYIALDETILWSIPLEVPTGSEECELDIPYLSWDDSYLLMQDFFAIGWRQGFIELKITHTDPLYHMVDMKKFVLNIADPAEQPINFQVLRDDSLTPETSKFPIVWVKGTAYLVLDVESGVRERQMFVEDFVVDGFAV